MVIGAENGGLMAVLVEPAQFSQPPAVAQAGAAFGQGQGGGFAIGVSDDTGSKFTRRPVGTGMFVIGENGDAPGFEALEKGRGSSLPGRRRG